MQDKLFRFTTEFDVRRRTAKVVLVIIAGDMEL